MLYTTYFAKLKNIEKKDKLFVAITRIAPYSLQLDDNFILCKDLSPSNTLLQDYKSKTISWEKYTDIFNKILEGIEDEDTSLYKDKNQNMPIYIEYLIEALENKTNKDIVLVCYEKDYIHCHRTIIAKYIEKILGIQVEEL